MSGYTLETKYRDLVIETCGKTGDCPSENLAKYGYQPNMKFKSLIILLYIWLQTGNQI